MGRDVAAWVKRIPHALSLARVLLVAATYPVALRGDAALFAVLVLLAILTDILDGPLARHLGTADTFGSNVDSAADILFYLSLPAWTYMFRPEVVMQQLPVMAVFAALYVAANYLSHRTFGAMGVHNRLSRASGTVGVVVAFYAILYGLHPLMYVALVALLSADLAQRYGSIVRARLDRRRPQGV